MTFHWILTVVAVAIALTAWAKARRLAKRLERLTESYWELRYEHGQLRARVNRVDPEEGPGNVARVADAEPAVPVGTTAFVPLSSLKR